MNSQKLFKKLLPLILVGFIAILVILLPGHEAHADTGSSVTSGLIGWIVYGIVYIISELAGVAIAFLTYLIGIILQLSDNVVNTLAVQSGFTVTLAVANLGFILGLIIIAIQTILNKVTYRSKGSLWKLIVAAILVNFSLVIGGVLINFANTFTNAFLNQLPGGSNSAAAGTSLSFGSMGFANELAGAFSPQRALLATGATGGGAAGGTTTSWWDTLTNTINFAANPVGSVISGALTSSPSSGSIADFITPLIGLVSATAFLVVVVITLAVFLVLLLTRYVTLTILLIVMPFAWLLWVFPGTSGMWKRWWREFIRWSFFAPVVVFFLWLAIATAQAMHSASGGTDLSFLSGAQYQAQAQGILGSLSSAFGTTIGTFAVTILQGVVVVGLAIGGMVAANSIGIKGANAAIQGATAAGNWAKGWSGRQGQKIASRAVPKKLKEKLEAGRYNFIPKRLQTVGGRALGNVQRAGGAHLVEQNEDWAKKMVKNDLGQAERTLEAGFGVRGAVSTEKGATLLKVMHEEGKLQAYISKGGRVGELSADEFLKKDGRGDALFKQFGQPKLREEIQEKSLLTDKVIDARGDLAAAKDSGVGVAAAEARLADEITKVLQKNKDVGSAMGYMKSDDEVKEMMDKLVKAGVSTKDVLKVRQNYEDMRQAVSMGVGKAFTGNAIGNMMGKFETSEQMNEYMDRVRLRVVAAPPAARPGFFNPQFINWLNNNAARNLGITPGNFGL
jgi:hypothetical protein